MHVAIKSVDAFYLMKMDRFNDSKNIVIYVLYVIVDDTVGFEFDGALK